MIWLSFLLLHSPATAGGFDDEFDDSDRYTESYSFTDGSVRNYAIRGINTQEFVASYNFDLSTDDTLSFTIQFYKDAAYGGSVMVKRQENGSTLLTGHHYNGTQVCSKVYNRGFRKAAMTFGTRQYSSRRDVRVKITLYLDDINMGYLECKQDMNRTHGSMDIAKVTYHTSTNHRATFKVWPPPCRTNGIRFFKSDFKEKPTFTNLPVASGNWGRVSCQHGKLIGERTIFRCSMGQFVHSDYLWTHAECEMYCTKFPDLDKRIISPGVAEWGNYPPTWSRKRGVAVKSGTTITLACESETSFGSEIEHYLEGNGYLYCNINGTLVASTDRGNQETPYCVKGCDGTSILKEGMSMNPSYLAPGSNAFITCHVENHELTGDPSVTCIKDDNFSYREKPDCVERKGNLFSRFRWIIIGVVIAGVVVLIGACYVYKKYQNESYIPEDLYAPADLEEEKDTEYNGLPTAPVKESSELMDEDCAGVATGDCPPSYSELMQGSV